MDDTINAPLLSKQVQEHARGPQKKNAKIQPQALPLQIGKIVNGFHARGIEIGAIPNLHLCPSGQAGAHAMAQGISGYDGGIARGKIWPFRAGVPGKSASLN